MTLSDKQEDREEALPTSDAAPESSETAAKAPEIAELEQQLAEKTQEAQEYYERLLRCAAEIDNLKKRQERERTELTQFANENLLKAMIPVLDNLERAMDHGRQFDAPEALMEGLELVHQEFLKVLNQFGVAPIDCVGHPFNPAFHHAVMEEEAPEMEDFAVLKELQRGYLLNSRLLRPSMVVVARNTKKSSGKIDLTV